MRAAGGEMAEEIQANGKANEAVRIAVWYDYV